jgi:hypothetical protein
MRHPLCPPSPVPDPADGHPALVPPNRTHPESGNQVVALILRVHSCLSGSSATTTGGPMAQSSSVGKPTLPHLPKWPIARWVPPDGEGGDPPATGPIVTFTIQIPFPLGFTDDSAIVIQTLGSWAESRAASAFGDKPFVSMRFSNIPIPNPKLHSERGFDVLKKHFDFLKSRQS